MGLDLLYFRDGEVAEFPAPHQCSAICLLTCCHRGLLGRLRGRCSAGSSLRALKCQPGMRLPDLLGSGLPLGLNSSVTGFLADGERKRSDV